jgi:hypothetical protein
MKKNAKVNIDSDGGPVFLEKVNNRGIIKGRSDVYHNSIDATDATRLFENLFKAIENHSKLSDEEKADLRAEIEELRQELSKKTKANESFLMRRLRNIGRMAPDILDVTLATITNPIAGFGVIAKKIAAKAKEVAT